MHVDRENCSANFWLEPFSLATNIGFSAIELRKIEKIVISSKKDFLEAGMNSSTLNAGGGFGIRWEELDEDLSTEGLLRGAPAPGAIRTRAA